MAKVHYKKSVNVLETLKSIRDKDCLYLSEDEVKISVIRSLYYQYKAEGLIDGSFSFKRLSGKRYIVVRTK